MRIGIRLQKYLAHAGIASRRTSEQLIASGRISVNGRVITEMGVRVNEGDTVCLDGTPVSPEEQKRYILLYKPSGYVSSLSDEKGRGVAADLLKKNYSERLYNVGRLDMYSSGALLFTNDGSFSAIVGHPSSEIEKEYIAETSLPYTDELIASFKKGIRIDSVFYKCREAERLSSRKLRIVLTEGKNREIRRVIEHFGFRVKKLERIRIGPVTLGDLNPGEFRELSADEIRILTEKPE
ncbi:rRNA pseudouridine synthase [Brucepastera parasyntrophica]|nr:pseudouridine synthase [Brucepastera parasyntrophica]ULQ61229.1 rRNA pseudouridine synthase [Brucepastera parasyntrophica]